MDRLEYLQPSTEHDIRVLTPEEIATVEHYFSDAGVNLPSPQESVFVGIVKDGKVMGFIVIQIRLHAEPLVLEPSQAFLLPALIRKAESVILERCGPQLVYLFAPAGKISQLAASFGMQMEPWVVMSKFVVPDGGKPPVDLDATKVEGLTQ